MLSLSSVRFGRECHWISWRCSTGRPCRSSPAYLLCPSKVALAVAPAAATVGRGSTAGTIVAVDVADNAVIDRSPLSPLTSHRRRWRGWCQRSAVAAEDRRPPPPPDNSFFAWSPPSPLFSRAVGTPAAITSQRLLRGGGKADHPRQYGRPWLTGDGKGVSSRVIGCRCRWRRRRGSWRHHPYPQQPLRTLAPGGTTVPMTGERGRR